MESRAGSRSILSRLVKVEPGEGAAVAWAFAYFFFLLSGWFIIRPLRDEMGVSGGEDRLAWLYMGTLAGTLIANPIFSSLVSHFTRRVFIPVVYRFLILNLLVFYALLSVYTGEERVHVARVFFAWASVFNLLAVSVFWGFMADCFRSEQGKRLFGFIGMGGTLGGLAGSTITLSLAEAVGGVNLILVAAALLEAAVFSVRRLDRIFNPRPMASAAASSGDVSPEAPRAPSAGSISPETPHPARRGGGSSVARSRDQRAEQDTPPGHGALEGLRLVMSSPYLLGICTFIFLYTISSTFLYFEQARIVGAAIKGSAERTAFFARVEFYVQVLTVLGQAFLTSRVIPLLGVGATLAFLPSLTLLGFGALSVWPTTAVLVAFQVIRRASEFTLIRPARETLFTVVSREEKYSSKSFIDTFVYRTGDVVGAWTDRLLAAFSFGAAGLAFTFLPLAVVWFATALFLGRRQKAMARGEAAASGEVPEALRQAPA